MAVKSLVAPSTKRPTIESNRYSAAQQFNLLLTSNFHSTTLLLCGGLLQGLLVLLFPRYWILLPSLIALFVRFADTLAITFHFRPNPYLEDSILQKWSPQVPDTNGNFSDTPANEKVAILLLSLKLNHPLGLFAPNVNGVNKYAGIMFKELDSENMVPGFLGQSQFTSPDVRGGLEILNISYWRSIEDVHAYAASPSHVNAVKWWAETAKKDSENMKHIGIAHEVFEAPRGKWEAVSLNFQPTRLGATSYLKKGDKLIGGVVDDQWISPVLAARGKLASSKGRLGWANDEKSTTQISDY